MPKHISLNECLWVYGEDIYRGTPNARPEIDALQPRGAKVFGLKIGAGADDLAQLRRFIRQSDAHLILTRLHPKELMAIKPILMDRKNFSVCCDDFCIIPHWFLCEAEYVVFRCYNGMAIRLGKPWTMDSPPLLFNPFISISKYSFAAAALRVPALAVSPFVNLANRFRRKMESTDPARYLYYPHSVVAKDLPIKTDGQYKYDFANNGSVCGLWIMRDPFVPFHHTLHQSLLRPDAVERMIQSFEGDPFTFYHNQGKMRFVGGLCGKNPASAVMSSTPAVCRTTSVPNTSNLPAWALR